MYQTPKILWLKTKNNVKEIIKTYKYFSLSLLDINSIKINKDFSIEINFENPQLSAIKIKNKQERVELVNHVINSYNKLKFLNRKIIYLTYFTKNKANDDVIANHLGFSSKYYYRIKKEAVIRFAFALGVEVLQGSD